LILAQEIGEDWFDERADLGVRVANPCDVCFGIERRIDRFTARGRDDYAGPFGDEFGAEVVGMAAMAGGDATLRGETLDEWTQVGDEAVLTDGEVVELAPGADVLVFEEADFAVLAFENAVAEIFIEGSEDIAGSREESADGRKAVAQGGRSRRCHFERRGFLGEPIVSDRLSTIAAYGPELITKMLLHERDFRLDGGFDVAESHQVAAVWGDASEDEAGAFLEHEAAGAVDWVDNDLPTSVAFSCGVWQDHAAVGQPLADKDDGFIRCDFACEPVDEGRLADSINGVDNVASAVVGNTAELGGRVLFAGGYDEAADRILEAADRFNEVGSVGHDVSWPRKLAPAWLDKTLFDNPSFGLAICRVFGLNSDTRDAGRTEFGLATQSVLFIKAET
jgi:hypothetical protein